MPTVLRIKNYRFFFFSNEKSEPRHIHVEVGHNYAKFWLEPVILVRSKGIKGHELTKIRKKIEENKEFLKEKWDEHFTKN